MYKISFFFIMIIFANSVSAAQMVYPAKGQSPEQQKKDEGECHTWAAENSGYDPTKPQSAPAASTQNSGPSGARIRGAARGAVVGEIADGDTGDAALAGAVMGGSRERRERRKAAQQAPASTAPATGQADYDKARAACLEGKGYSVK